MTKHTAHARFGPAAMILGGLALVTMLAGCASGSGTDAGGNGSGGETSSATVVGTWGQIAPRQPYLTFDADASVAGNDGCNSLGSTYTVEGDTVTFSRATSTLMACIGVDSWLSALSTAVVDGDQLIVKNENGDTIGTLTKSA